MTQISQPCFCYLPIAHWRTRLVVTWQEVTCAKHPVVIVPVRVRGRYREVCILSTAQGQQCYCTSEQWCPPRRCTHVADYGFVPDGHLKVQASRNDRVRLLQEIEARSLLFITTPQHVCAYIPHIYRVCHLASAHCGARQNAGELWASDGTTGSAIMRFILVSLAGRASFSRNYVTTKPETEAPTGNPGVDHSTDDRVDVGGLRGLIAGCV